MLEMPNNQVSVKCQIEIILNNLLPNPSQINFWITLRSIQIFFIGFP